ncbi:MAG: cobalamin-binding protein [archaeon]|nr:cobalamin-binding protein [archaeon]MCP8321931.1 cobalamin-binding protein [archaeon]
MQVGKTGLVALFTVILVTGAITAYNFYTISQLNQKIDELTVNLNTIFGIEVFKDAYDRTILVAPQGIEVPEILTFGRTIVRVPPQRIASFFPSMTETLFAIGLGDQVVAVTKWCEWPQEMVDKKNAGNLTVFESIIDPEVEKVVTANPDLILVLSTLMRPEGVAKLEDLGFTVVGIDYGESLDDIYNAITLIGKLTGAEDSAEELINELQQNITRVSNAVANLPKPKVFWMSWHDPLMSAGGPSFINTLIQTAGGVNIFESVNIAWPFVSSEEVLAQDPDAIIFSEGHPGISNVDDLLSFFPAWSEIEAVEEGRVFAVPDSFIHPGPRTAEAIEILAELIHQIEI